MYLCRGFAAESFLRAPLINVYSYSMRHISRPVPRLQSLLLLLFVATLSAQAQVISLAGEWNFSLDPRGDGCDARWYERTLP